MKNQKQSLLLGTRGSALALAQCNTVLTEFKKKFPDIITEQKIIHTSGDKLQNIPLSQISKLKTENGTPIDKGVFIKELEIALQSGEIAAAVHSLKDVPSQLEEGFSLPAILPRAPIEDILITRLPLPQNTEKALQSLPKNACIATSSIRRQCLLQWHRSDLTIAPIRGNVPTRLEKFANLPQYTATILARAGLERLGIAVRQRLLCLGEHTLHLHPLDPQLWPPAGGQGAIAIETYEKNNDSDFTKKIASLNDYTTAQCVTAERHFLKLLNASCQTPIGIHAKALDNQTMSLNAIVFDEKNPTAPPWQATEQGSLQSPEEIAKRLFEKR